jgi:hypothetical protein
MPVTATCLITLFACSKHSVFSPVYTPVITFSGYINNDSVYLPGNRWYPNTCRIEKGCVRIYLYSENYTQGGVSAGDQMRIDVFNADSAFLTERRSLFNLIRYDAIYTTETYTITPSDSLNDWNNFHAKVESFDERHGGSVRLTDMSVAARPLGQFASQPLMIAKGTVSGAIE